MISDRRGAAPLVVTMLAVLTLSLASCGTRGANGDVAAATGEQDAAPVVPVATAARADLSTDLVLTAEFEPFQEVDVMAKVAGYLRSLTVDIGDRVTEGQLLASLEIPEMDDDRTRAAASVEEADAAITAAADELRRAESSHALAHLSYTRIGDVSKREPGLVPQQEVDEAQSRDRVAEDQVAAAKSHLRVVEQRTRVVRSDQSRVETLRRYASITAPFAGVVTKRYASVGSMIQAGTASQTQVMPVVRLSQNNLLRLILPVPESVAARIRPGQVVQVKVPSLSRTFPGRVARFAGRVQQSTRTMDTEVDVQNRDLVLVPGMFAEVSLRLEQHDGVLAVPLEAVERSSGAPQVYTVAPPGTIHIVPVALGVETDQRVEIHSGLREGDIVVTGRRAGLQEGQRVSTGKTAAGAGLRSKE